MLGIARSSFDLELYKIAESENIDPVIAASAGSAGLGLTLSAPFKEKVKLNTDLPITIIYTDPSKGSGHFAQGKALAQALERKGKTVRLINIDKEYSTPKNFNAMKELFKKRLKGEVGDLEYALLHHAPFYQGLDWKKFKADTDGSIVINTHAGVEVYTQQYAKNPMYTLHTDQAPFKSSTLGLHTQKGVQTQHIASRSAKPILEKENPSLKGRVHEISDLAISSNKKITDERAKKAYAAFQRNKSGTNITISGGGIGLDVDIMTKQLLSSDFSQANGKVTIHAITGLRGDPSSTNFDKNYIEKLKAIESTTANSKVRLKVYGFSPLRAMMEESDLNVFRPGGTTISEARSTGKPFAIFSQEKPGSVSGRNVKAVKGLYAMNKGLVLNPKKPNAQDSVDMMFSSIKKSVFKSKQTAPTGGADEAAKIVTSLKTGTSLPSNALSRKVLAGSFIAAGAGLAGVGFWRRLKASHTGKDQNSNPVSGKTWVKKASEDKAPKVNVGMAAVSGLGLALGAKLGVRGRRLRKLEKLVPKLTTDNKAQFKSKLNIGDLLLIGKGNLKGKAAWASKITRPSEGFNVHTAMYVGKNQLIDVVPKGNKMRKMSIDSYLKADTNLLVVRPKESKDKIRKSVQIANQAFSKNEYKYGGNKVRQVLRGALGDTRFERKITKKFFPKTNKAEVICSSMIADIQSRAGFKHKKSPSMMTTIDFRSMKKPPVLEFKPKGLKRYKTSKFQGAGITIPSLALGVASVKKD